MIKEGHLTGREKRKDRHTCVVQGVGGRREGLGVTMLSFELLEDSLKAGDGWNCNAIHWKIGHL